MEDVMRDVDGNEIRVGDVLVSMRPGDARRVQVNTVDVEGFNGTVIEAGSMHAVGGRRNSTQSSWWRIISRADAAPQAAPEVHIQSAPPVPEADPLLCDDCGAALINVGPFVRNVLGHVAFIDGDSEETLCQYCYRRSTESRESGPGIALAPVAEYEDGDAYELPNAEWP